RRAVAEGSADPLLEGGNAGLQLGATRLELGEALPRGLEPRLLAGERRLVLPGERVGLSLTFAGLLESGPGGFELGGQAGRRGGVDDLLGHRAGLAGSQPLAEVLGLVQADRAMEGLLGRLEAALRLLGRPPGRLGFLLEPLALPGLLFQCLALRSQLGRALG